MFSASDEYYQSSQLRVTEKRGRRQVLLKVTWLSGQISLFLLRLGKRLRVFHTTVAEVLVPKRDRSSGFRGQRKTAGADMAV
jgi:hypothetical protein